MLEFIGPSFSPLKKSNIPRAGWQVATYEGKRMQKSGPGFRHSTRIKEIQWIPPPENWKILEKRRVTYLNVGMACVPPNCRWIRWELRWICTTSAILIARDLSPARWFSRFRRGFFPPLLTHMCGFWIPKINTDYDAIEAWHVRHGTCSIRSDDDITLQS